MKNQFISGNLSFASGGDGETDTLDYVAYVAKVHYIYYLSIYKSLTSALFSYSWIAKLVESSYVDLVRMAKEVVLATCLNVVGALPKMSSPQLARSPRCFTQRVPPSLYVS